MSNICGHHINYNNNNSCFNDATDKSLPRQHRCNAVQQNKLNGKIIKIGPDVKKIHKQLKTNLSSCNGDENSGLETKFCIK